MALTISLLLSAPTHSGSLQLFHQGFCVVSVDRYAARVINGSIDVKNKVIHLCCYKLGFMRPSAARGTTLINLSTLYPRLLNLKQRKMTVFSFKIPSRADAIKID